MSDFRVTIAPDKNLRAKIRKSLSADPSVKYEEFDEVDLMEAVGPESMQILGHGFSFLTLGGLAAMMKYAAPVLIECLKRGRVKIKRGDLTIEAASVSDLDRALQVMRDQETSKPAKTAPRKKAT